MVSQGSREPSAQRLASGSLTGRLAAALRWGSDSTEFATAALQAHLAQLRDRVQLLLPTMQHGDLRLLSCLDESSWIRILLAPSSSHALRTGGRSPTSFLLKAAAAELIRTGEGWEAIPVGGRIQTALGDRTWERDTDGRCRCRRSPLVRGIVVDTSRAYADRALHDLESEMNDCRAVEVDRLMSAIGKALDTTVANSPAAGELIVQCVRVISLRRDGANSVSSSSLTTFPGYLRLVNADPDDEAALIDALLHEAIHNLLYLVESTESWYSDREAVCSQVRSPWSGRDIQVHSFVHANFVWFGLLNFWASFSHDPARARAMFRRAAKGFGDDDLERLVDSSQGVEPHVKETLGKLIARARRTRCAVGA